MDPRVTTATEKLQVQHDLSYSAYAKRKDAIELVATLASLKSQLSAKKETLTKSNNNAANTLKADILKMENSVEELRAATTKKRDEFATVFSILQDTDMPPTAQSVKALKGILDEYSVLMGKWGELKQELTKLNGELGKAKLTKLEF